MKAYGFIINGRGSGNGYDRKCSPGDQVGKCDHHSNSTHRMLRAHKRVARRVGKDDIKEALNDIE